MADSTNWAIVDVSADDDSRLSAVAGMHMDLLAFGPMAPLGERFVRVVGYELPITDGLMSVACLEYEGRLAGFIAYTEKAEGFYAAALSRHPWRVLKRTISALIGNPARFLALLRAARIVLARSRGAPNEQEASGAEITAIAVSPDFSSARFVRRTGLRVSQELISHAKKDLRARGVRRLRGIVDGFNKPTVMMFAQLGATISPIEQAGEPMFLVSLSTE